MLNVPGRTDQCIDIDAEKLLVEWWMAVEQLMQVQQSGWGQLFKEAMTKSVADPDDFMGYTKVEQ